MAFILKISYILALIILIYVFNRILCKHAKKTPFSYKNVTLLGAIIFLLFNAIIHLFDAFRYATSGAVYYYDIHFFFSDIGSSFTSFTYYIFPFVLLFAFFLAISNIVLIAKDGFRITNLLGIILGVVLIIGTFGLSEIYTLFDSFIDVHSYLGHHITIGIENILSITISYFECMFIATIITTIKTVKYKPVMDKDYVLILGCYVMPDGTPGGILRKRIEAAHKFACAQKDATGKAPIIVASGGKGDDESLSEAESMRNYLRKEKQYEGKILLEDKSTNTRQNFRYSRQLIPKNSKIAFATTDYHVFRSGVIASKLGIHNIVGIGAKSPWYFYNNALIREFAANISSEKRFHIAVLVFLNLISTIFLICSYNLDLI